MNDLETLRVLKPGEFIGDYQVLSILGASPSGISYHVINNVQNKEFVLKTLMILDTMPMDWLPRLDAQTALLRQLNATYIDRPLGSGRFDNLWFLVKDFIHDGEGKSCNLIQYMERHNGKLSEFQVYHIFKQILEALNEAREFRDANHNGICHGNLKPENILIAYGNSQDLGLSIEVKLSDFQPYALFEDEVSIQQLLAWEELITHFDNPHESILESMLKRAYSRYDYMPLEQKENGVVDESVDLYATGVLLYQMLTSELPQGFNPKVSLKRKGINPCWDEICFECLQVSPQQRNASYTEIIERLQLAFPEFHQAEIAKESIEKELPIQEGEEGSERLSLTPKGMVYIPSGEFLVGSEECGEDAKPIHISQTEGFYIAKFCVSNFQFEQFVKASSYVTEAEKGGGAPIWLDGQWQVLEGISWKNPTGNPLPKDFQAHPVTQITLEDAKAYCDWAGLRLPTEQEWECAAKGGLTETKYPWGNTISKANANFMSDKTVANGSYPANAYGLYDMAGNVWEWTDSCYAPYPGNESSNPHFSQELQVVRGGAWLYDAPYCLVAFRNANQKSRCYPTLGFRCVKDFKA
ncbi:MAG: SUMF1/EgtB/PvdO family nonheme iron enzyme [Chlamydiales bacterium]|nr:SUMF1/EgtB/PvdO family nonheme iron enzyme [Chlamydiales bacterium]NCF70684.1 SUMF1/EgtB/PvdO family nonheme iron enzyme [Chlamydiales bacterium]